MGKETISSSQAREQAFILLFEKSFNPEFDCKKTVELALECEAIKKSNFTTDLFYKAIDNVVYIDGIIEKYSKGWNVSRISKVSLAILRLAICEMMFFEKTPIGVVINEAVTLCKTYASEDEYTFVNGILGAIAKEERK